MAVLTGSITDSMRWFEMGRSPFVGLEPFVSASGRCVHSVDGEWLWSDFTYCFFFSSFFFVFGFGFVQR